ncbi:hypothetical protein Ddye_019422 [Dipteronia dyeriana]|uniref:Uncharacterized protein n=1 Tax=Dipteronia dyeriana TaxID=168575 RepID=A0AAD9TY23_9ROSI|nr:hypothetical protein Ddye_019422 [Dipteronia dyeriana]
MLVSPIHNHKVLPLLHILPLRDKGHKKERQMLVPQSPHSFRLRISYPTLVLVSPLHNHKVLSLFHSLTKRQMTQKMKTNVGSSQTTQVQTQAKSQLTQDLNCKCCWCC